MNATPLPRKESLSLPGVACGHGALCAASGLPIGLVMSVLPGDWVNIPMMKFAVHALRQRFTEPAEVVMIQWEGPWMAPNRPPVARCKYRHWIARRGDQVWDINEPAAWMPQTDWESYIPDLLMPKNGTGWHELRSIRIHPFKERWTPTTKQEDKA